MNRTARCPACNSRLTADKDYCSLACRRFANRNGGEAMRKCPKCPAMWLSPSRSVRICPKCTRNAKNQQRCAMTPRVVAILEEEMLNEDN